MGSIYDDMDPIQKLFYFDIEEFFDLSSLESMYRSDTDRDKNDLSELDLRSITNNDRNFFDRLLRRAGSEAYKIMQPLGQELTDAYIFNAIPKTTVEDINDTEVADLEEDLLYEMTDAGTITLGSLVVIIGDKVKYDGSVWVKDNDNVIKYILYYLNLPYNFDLNNQTPLDEKIQEFISVWVVKEWFKRQKYDLSLILEEEAFLRLELKRIINYRRVTHRRPTQIF